MALEVFIYLLIAHPIPPLQRFLHSCLHGIGWRKSRSVLGPAGGRAGRWHPVLKVIGEPISGRMFYSVRSFCFRSRLALGMPPALFDCFSVVLKSQNPAIGMKEGVWIRLRVREFVLLNIHEDRGVALVKLSCRDRRDVMDQGARWCWWQTYGSDCWCLIAVEMQPSFAEEPGGRPLSTEHCRNLSGTEAENQLGSVPWTPCDFSEPCSL